MNWLTRCVGCLGTPEGPDGSLLLPVTGVRAIGSVAGPPENVTRATGYTIVLTVEEIHETAS